MSVLITKEPFLHSKHLHALYSVRNKKFLIHSKFIIFIRPLIFEYILSSSNSTWYCL
jgi:hypothetical protein